MSGSRPPRRHRGQALDMPLSQRRARLEQLLVDAPASDA
ncbi:hypothetical protein MicB006_3112 [Micromonospora sp. B006]|nr:hypothetical protein MicB006_3112 [Micromonospora sp. B006]